MDRTRELALVSALRQGDSAAFDALYEHWSPRVFAFLVRLCRRRDLAEDLHQETWLRLARSAATLEDDLRPGAWLFRVARNLFVSYRRWALLDIDRLQELSLWPRGEGEPESPFERAAASELERDLERALAALPVRYREALLLVGVERMTPAEAAEVLGIRPDALRQRLARARAMMAELLEVTEGGEVIA